MKETIINNKVDRLLFFLVVLLLSLSILMSYSLSVYAIKYYGYHASHFLIRQFFSVSLAIILMWVISQFDADKLFLPLGFFIFFASIFLIIIMPFLPSSLVSSAGGAKRWIRLPGFSLTPVEFFKLGFTVFLSWSFSRKFIGTFREDLLSEIAAFAPYVVLFAFIAFFIAVVQNDLGQVVLMAVILGVLLLFAGGSLKLLGVIFLSLLSLATLLIITSTHRINRIRVWWAGIQDGVLSLLPSSIAKTVRLDNLPEPYQIYYSLSSMHNGGIFGLGLGNGVIKLGFLSEVHTDIVLAGITEELGFIGLSLTILIFYLIIHRILRIANHTKSPVQSLYCVGIASMLSFALIVNAFGVAGLLPIKGIAVPFISYGGSAIIANSIAIGMVLSISRNSN